MSVMSVSASDLSDAALKRTLHSDSQLLHHYFSSASAALSDASVAATMYREVVSGVGTQAASTATALGSWLPPLCHERRYTKQLKLRKKAADTAALLSLLPEHEEARSRLLKCMQRSSHFLVSRIDTHAHLMHMRSQLLLRYHLALERWARREDISAIVGAGFAEDGSPLPAGSARVEPTGQETAEDKMRFLELLFARSLSEVEDPPPTATSVRYTSFESTDEFVAQLFSLIPDNLPSAPTLEEEIERMQNQEDEEKRAALAAVAVASGASSSSSSSSASAASPVSPAAVDSKPAPQPVRLFGVTGLMGLPFLSPSALAAAAEESAQDENEPKPSAGEDDATYAARLHSYIESQKQAKKKKHDLMQVVKRKKMLAQEAKKKERDARDKQAKMARADALALAQAEALAAGETDSPSLCVDPDLTLPPEARFSSLHMLELVLEESKTLTLAMIDKAAQEFEAWREFKKQQKTEEDAKPATAEAAQATPTAADAAADASAASPSSSSSSSAEPRERETQAEELRWAAYQQARMEASGTAASTSVYPLSPLPVTHLLQYLLRDLLRKATLCTAKGQTTARQLLYVLKRVFAASSEIFAASQSLLDAQTASSQLWAEFEKTVKFESPAAGSIPALFESCKPKAAAVPNAPAQGPAGAAAASSSSSSSSSSAAAAQAPAVTAASPHAPLLSTLLSQSIVGVVTLPSLSYIWTFLFRAPCMEGLAEEQQLLRGTMEYPAPDEGEEDQAAEAEEKKDSEAAAMTQQQQKTAPPPTFNLFKILVSFLKQVDALNACLPSTAAEECLAVAVSSAPMSTAAANHLGVIVESPHTYFADSEDAQVVHIPNASYLVVEFDPRCSSERNRDHLTITVPQDDLSARLGLAMPQPPQKVAGPFHGPRDQWPRMPIVISNANTLVFNFHSEQANNASTYFGYRAIVTGYTHTHEIVPPPAGTGAAEAANAEIAFVNKTVHSTIQPPTNMRASAVGAPKQTLSHSRPFYFMVDLQQSLAHVVGRVVRKEVVGAAATLPPAAAPVAGAAGGAAANAAAAAAAAAKESESKVDEESLLAKYLNSPLFFNEDQEDGAEDPAEAETTDPDASKAKQAAAAEESFELRFLREIIDAKAGTPGAQLDTLLRKKLQTKRVDQLGGPVTKRVVRLFVAVLLKHLGLTRMAALWLVKQGVAVAGVELPAPRAKEDPTADKNDTSKATQEQQQPTTIASVFAGSNNAQPVVEKQQPTKTVEETVPQTEQDWTALCDQLVQVWTKGQTMHQFIVSSKQLNQQALDTLIEEAESAAKVAALAAATPAAPAAAPAPAAGSVAALAAQLSGFSIFNPAPPAAAAAASSSSSSASSSSSSSASAPPAAVGPNPVEVRLAQIARAKAEKMATYEGFTENLAAKCEYLLLRPSFAHHPLSSLQTSVPVAAAPALDAATDALSVVHAVRSSSQDSSDGSLRSLLSLYHTTNQRLADSDAVRATTHQVFQSLTDLISTFVRDEIPLRTIRRIRRKQVERAIRRAEGMETLLSLFKTLRHHSSHIALLSTFGPPFRQYVMYGMGLEDEPGPHVGGHYLQRIEASGKKYRQLVQQSFNGLYAWFIEQLREGSTASLAFQGLVLDSLCIDWHASVRENSWIVRQQLLPILDAIIQPRIVASNAASAASEVVGGAPETTLEPTPFQQLAANLLNFISINSLTQLRSRMQGLGAKAQRKLDAAAAAKKEQKEEEKAMVPVAERKSMDDGDDEKHGSSSTAAASAPTPSPSPPPATGMLVSPFAFLTTPASFNTTPLDTLQRSVLDRLVASLQHSASLLSGLRRTGGESVQDAEIVDISLTPEQKHLLYRRKTRPSASSATSSSSIQERQAASQLGISLDDDGSAGGDGEDDLDFADAHPSFPLIRRFIELEQSSFETLALLTSISSDQHHRSYLEYICSPTVLRTLLLVFISGSPRMQTIAIRVLAKVLPLVSAFQVRDNSLYESLISYDKDERFGSRAQQATASTPSTASASSTPFSAALIKSYEPSTMDSFSLGDSLPVPQTLALSRSSSLQARLETDAILSSGLDPNEDRLDQLDVQKMVTFLFKRLAELQLATTEQQDGGVAVPRPSTPQSGTTGFGAMSSSSSLSNINAAKAQPRPLNPLQCNDGAMKQILASELVTLLRTLHAQTTVPAAPGSNAAPTTNTDWSSAIKTFLSTHLLSLAKLVAPDEPRISSPSAKNAQEVGIALACLSVIGGHSEVLRVGGMVAGTQRGGEREQGILISVDRLGNRAKVLFRHTPNRVIECDLTKVKPIDTVQPDAGLVTLNRQLLQVFEVFTRALQQEENERIRAEEEARTKAMLAAEEAEVRRLQKQFEEEEKALNDPFGGFRDEIAAFWPCPACTFESPMTKPTCELCGHENPNFFLKKATVEEESDIDEAAAPTANRMTLTNEHMLYYQLRSKSLKALCVLLTHPHSLRLLFEGSSGSADQSMLPSLVSMAIRPTHLDVFKSIDALEESENRLLELVMESSSGLVQDHLRFNRQKNQGSDLKFSPFRNMQLHLPSSLDVASARGVSFLDRDSLCEVKYNGVNSGGMVNVGLVRANFLVPHSLPSFYVEYTIHSVGAPTFPASGAGGPFTPRSGSNSPQLTPQLVRKNSPVLRALASPSRGPMATPPNLGGAAAAATPASGSAASSSASSAPGSSSAFDIAFGWFRCGMPLEGWPGKHSTYAYSGRNGELHLTRSRSVMRSKMFESFKAGDTVGCGIQLRHGQRTIFFTKNGKLLKAIEQVPDELDSFDLGPTAVGGSGSANRSRTAFSSGSSIVSISGVEANLSGRFYPCIWFENAGAHVSVNFGQSKFAYDFAAETLPPEFLKARQAEDAAMAASGGKKLSAVELKRRTMAEDLCEMMGNFPLDLCVMALERNNDDKAVAGDWLFSSGAKELEQMAQHALRSQADKKRAGANANNADDGESSGEDEDLSDYLAGGDASNQGGRGDRGAREETRMLDDEVDQDIPLALDLAPRQQQQQAMRGGAAAGGRGGVSELERQRERARQLLSMRGRDNLGEDELQNILASVLGGPAAGGAGGDDESLTSIVEPICYDNVRIDEIEPGARLVVAPGAVRLTAGQHGWMQYFAGRMGVVTAININSALVTLIFHDTLSAVKRCASFPIYVLQLPQRMWLDPCRDLYERQQGKAEEGADAAAERNASWQDLAHELVSIEKALSVQKVRRAVLRVIATWPRQIPFDATRLGGPSGVLAILKLTAAQFLSSKLQGKPKAGGEHEADVEGLMHANLLDSLRQKLIQLVQAENEKLMEYARSNSKTSNIAPPLRITEKLYLLPAAASSEKSGASDKDKSAAASSGYVSASASASSAQHGYSSASANESEDESFAALRRPAVPASGGVRRDRVALPEEPLPSLAHAGSGGDEEEDEDDGGDDEEDDDGSASNSDPDGEGDGSQYDEAEQDEDAEADYGAGEMGLDDLLQQVGGAAGGQAMPHGLARGFMANLGLAPNMGGGGGYGAPAGAMFGAPQGMGARAHQGFNYIGRSSVAPAALRARRPKKKAADGTDLKTLHASLDEKLQQQLQQPRGSSAAGAPGADSFVTPLLIEEAITHFIQSVNHGPPIKTFRSAHPYPSSVEKRGRVQIGGASKLLIRFDPRCQIATDLMSRLVFYRDGKYQDVIATVQGSGPAPDGVFPPLIIEGDRFWYKFTSGSNSRNWGYKIRVEPIDQRIDDKSALLGRNFELSGWLLDLFLASFPPLFQTAYITEMYNAVVWYVCNVRPSMKSRGVDMLVRLLFHVRSMIHKEQAAAKAAAGGAAPAAEKSGSALSKLADLKSSSSSSSSTAAPSLSLQPPSAPSSGFVPTLSVLPDFKKLSSLAQQMGEVLEQLGLNNAAPLHGGARAHSRSLQSPTMMGVVELLSTVDLLNNEFEAYTAAKNKEAGAEPTKLLKEAASASLSLSSASSDANGGIDLVDQWTDRLRIDKATLLFHVPPTPQSASSSAPAASAGGASMEKDKPRTSKDITADLQRYLTWSQGIQLFIPTDPALLKEIPGFEKEVSASALAAQSGAAGGASGSSGAKKIGFHRLALTYSILTPFWNPATQNLEHRVSKQLHKTVSLLSHSKPTLIKPVASRFDSVVNMSRLTLEMKQSASSGSPPRLPSEFLLESYRNYSAQRNFVALVGDRVMDSVANKPRCMHASPSAGIHNGTRSYTLSFWVYLGSATLPAAKDQHFRYIFHAGNLPDQSPQNLNHGQVWPQAGFSVGLGAKDNNLHTIFYESSGSSPLYQHSRNTISAKRWTHITLIVTDGVDISLYIDGSVEITQKLQVPLPALTTDPFFVGALPAGILKLYRNQNIQRNAAADAAPEEPYRQGLGFTGSIKDMRFYSHDVDATTFVPMFQERAAVCKQERGNLGSFRVQVDKPTLVTRREIQDIVNGGAQGTASSSSAAAKSAPASWSMAASCSSSSSSASSASSSSSTSVSSVVWTPAMDIQVMELFNSVVTAVRNRRPQEQPEEEDEDQPRPQRESFVHLLDLPLASKNVTSVIAADPKLMSSANLLSHLPLEVLKARFATIQLLNSKLIDVLPFVDFSQALNPWSLAHRLSNISWLILMEVKSKAWRSILHSTATGQTVNITINRPRALKARERGNDPDGLKSNFGQVFQQLQFLRPQTLRCQQGARPFRVKFSGEGGIDAGGLYRDAVSEVCSTLLSRDTPLFIPCPNASGFGDNGNTWLPNPKCNTTLHMSMYAFVGKWVGLALRGGAVLNLDLPAVLWKLIVATPITRADIQDINALCFKILEQYADPALTEETFAELPPQRFVTMSTDGREVELRDNGANQLVTLSNRAEYVRLEEHYRLHEFDLAVSQIRKGLGTIVPVHLLSLFTASEVETMVCGSREINIDFLRRNTVYSGLRPGDAHVKYFWSVLEEMSQKERQMFIRFVSGQSRLWNDDKDFTMKFKLQPSAVDNDSILPVSHTCFFSLELPKYSSVNVMRAKLMYSIQNCFAIDADTAADNLDWNAED